MPKNIIGAVCFGLLALTFNTGAIGAVSGSPPPWLALTNAYTARQDTVIGKFSFSPTKSVQLYARALLDLSKHRTSVLARDGEACYSAKPENGADAAAYFGCLFAVGTGFKLGGDVKSFYVWRAKVIDFYNRYDRLINEATGSNDPANIKELASPGVTAVRRWPEQSSSVNENWERIVLKERTATAYIDGKPIKVLIDTGSTGIRLSKNDIKQKDLADKLIPLQARVGAADYSNGFISNLYYVRQFRLGPIEIENAYVTDGPSSQSNVPGSVVGIGVLAGLGTFSISATSVAAVSTSNSNGCWPMMFTREGVTRGYSNPFVRVSTTAGKLGLMLDSGAYGFDQFSDIGVKIFPNKERELISADAIELTKQDVRRRFNQNGKEIYRRTDLFDISIAGVATHGMFGVGTRPDPLLSGSLMFSFLKQARVVYDFPDKKMCIRPLQKMGTTGNG